MTADLIDGRRLILASTSPFRRELLARLGLPFDVQAPQVSERALPAEAADARAARLARSKAAAVAEQHVNALVIGSDQVALCDGEVLGKPGSHARAVAQLRRASGKTVSFFTGLCLFDAVSGCEQTVVEPFQVVFRTLTREQIERYLVREQPYQCAGSFKAEGLGIALFERLRGDDPNSLIGLPLIRLTRLLEAQGIPIL